MKSRLLYIVMRAREAGLRGVFLKVASRLWPLLHWPIYSLKKLPSVGAAEEQAFRLFGSLCADAFASAHCNDPTRLSRAEERAVLAQRSDFPLLGYGNLPKPTGSAWHLDPKHAYAWEPRYFPFVNFLAAQRPSDVKIPWELSRLQWLVWWAEESVHAPPSCQHAHKKRFLATLNDWWEANPAGYGIHWVCGMEVAIRATNIAIAAGAFVRFMEKDEVRWVCALLRAHELYLRRFPETSDVPGNHYLADLMGEVVLAAALTGMAARKTEVAFAKFALAADAQFEAGGCHIERATIYHRLTHEIVALPYALALRAGSASIAKLAHVVLRSSQFMAQIADDQGRLPVFGDQDSGFVIWFGESAQIADKRVCMAAEAPETDLYSFLSALSGAAGFFAEVKRTAGCLSGFSTIAHSKFRVTMKTGPIGLDGRAAHDHDDALAVCLSWKGEPVVIDPGCHSYTLSPKLRLEAILSSRHNAPAPAERERHAPSAGSINATMRGAPTARLQGWSPIETCGVLSRTPASRMAAARTLRISQETLEINDFWQFDSPEAARTFWLFDPSWRFENAIEWRPIAEDPALVLFNRSNERLHLCIEAPASAHLRCFPHYFSPDYGAFTDCWALEIVAQAALEGRMSIRLSGQA